MPNSSNYPLVKPSYTVSNDREAGAIDLTQIVAKAYKNWHLFAISAMICVTISYVYAYKASSTWHVSGKILVKDDKGSPQSVLSGTMSGDFGSLFNAKSDADNEMQILKSRTLMQNTVKSMQLNVRTFEVRRFKTVEIFDESPFEVLINYKRDTLVKRFFDIDIANNKEYKISNSDEDLEKNATFGSVLHLQQYDLALKYKTGAKHSGHYKILIEAPELTADLFQKDFKVELADKQASAIDLSLAYQHPAKGEAILNKIIELYLQSNLLNEKSSADSTYAFINARIQLVSAELNNIEKQFEKYKTQNNIANITEQSKSLVTNASAYYDKLAQQEIQLEVIEDLEKYLHDPKNKNAIPSSLINPYDQSFGLAINAYNDLLRSRDRAGLSYTESNPIIANLNVQVNNARSGLLNNIETYKKSLQEGKKQLQKENSGFAGQLKQLPAKERNYLDFSRQQNLKQELYLYLLQKREETAISRNATLSSSRILDYAKSEFLPFKPVKPAILSLGFILGLVLPAIYLFLKELLNTKVNDKIDIESRTSVAILGEIGHNSDKQSLVTGVNSRTVISEEFRSLRTNLQFVLNASVSNVILFTSSMSGEGKSFLSLNVGSALALTGKRVVFLEMDLRRPKMSESLGLTKENGFTNYAISNNPDFNFETLLKPLLFNENCFLISSGPIPPNPAEILTGEKMDKLIAYLRTKFDYIIIDCAPVGLVTDALILEKYADLLFYVVRQGYTMKSQINILNDLTITNNIKNVYMIVNDIKTDLTGSSGYRQSYGYGIEEEKTSLLSKIKFWR